MKKKDRQRVKDFARSDKWLSMPENVKPIFVRNFIKTFGITRFKDREELYRLLGL